MKKSTRVIAVIACFVWLFSEITCTALLATTDGERICAEMGAQISHKKGCMTARFADSGITVLIKSTGGMTTISPNGTVYGVNRKGRLYFRINGKTEVMACKAGPNNGKRSAD